jgi:RNA polymerase sigma-70 factor (ECF subfamily)
MRLMRKDNFDEEATLLVGVVDPPALPAESALEQLYCDMYVRVHDRARDYAGRFLSRDDAKDAVQEAALKVWRIWTRLRPDQRNDAYFFRAVHNCVRDAREAARKFVRLEDAEIELEALAVRAADKAALEERITDVLNATVAAMTPERREVYLLVCEQEFTYKDAAATLRVSEQTINYHIVRARKDVRAAYAREGYRVTESHYARLPAGTPTALPPGTGSSAND